MTRIVFFEENRRHYNQVFQITLLITFLSDEIVLFRLHFDAVQISIYIEPVLFFRYSSHLLRIYKIFRDSSQILRISKILPVAYPHY